MNNIVNYIKDKTNQNNKTVGELNSNDEPFKDFYKKFHWKHDKNLNGKKTLCINNINGFIKEGLKITSKTKVDKRPKYNYHPKHRQELKRLLIELFKERGRNADLNDIDISNVTNLEQIFDSTMDPHDINISEWDVSNVKDMYGMFEDCKNFVDAHMEYWDVSNVEDMRWMFNGTKFNGDISTWNVSKVKNMQGMFSASPFNGDLSNWNPKECISFRNMFEGCPLRIHNKLPKWYVNAPEKTK